MLLCDVDGTRDGKKLQLKLWSESPEGKAACDWIKGSNDVSWLTSVPASIFALMLLRDQVKHKGVFPPEVFDREEIEIFYRGIREWGIRVIKQTRAAVI
jgi:saccharopine dehydrogenase-like NADP-dependent oxidoreductase